LPPRPFELATWKVATVGPNYHISVEKMNYSVPYEYIRQKVDVHITRNTVEVFFGGNRICSHVRLYGRANQYSTTEAHMPPNHRQYSQWNGDRFRRWAGKIGPNTGMVVSAILSGYKVEQQGYKSCLGLLKLGGHILSSASGGSLYAGFDLHAATFAQEHTGHTGFRPGQAACGGIREGRHFRAVRFYPWR
jgi:hypothetical protein